VTTSLRKKIIGVSVVLMALAMICAQTTAAAPSSVEAFAWTDKPWYNPGDSGKLMISVLNPTSNPVEIYNITVIYPWGPRYDANTGAWEGNVTIKLSPPAIMTSGGGHYYTEQDFTIPNSGGSAGGSITITVWTNLPIPLSSSASIQVVGSSPTGAPILNMEMLGLNAWMMSLVVVIVICTIILAIVIFLSTRRTPAAPRVIVPPPTKAKAE
jgi:hypothetical protein